MTVRWVPYAAASLSVGALALLVGSLLMPTSASAGESLGIVADNDGRWLGVAALFLLGSVGMTLGLPAVLTLLPDRGSRLGLVALGVFAVGTICTSGYAVLLVFYRALVLTDSLTGPLDGITSEPGIVGFLAVLLGSFYGGELLLALALLRAGTVPRWVPAVLVGHVAMLGVDQLLPAFLHSYGTLLLTAGLCALAIAANERASQLGPLR